METPTGLLPTQKLHQYLLSIFASPDL